MQMKGSRLELLESMEFFLSAVLELVETGRIGEAHSRLEAAHEHMRSALKKSAEEAGR